MISKQAHLVVQRIQEEQHLEKDKEIDSLHDIVNNLEVRLEHQEGLDRASRTSGLDRASITCTVIVVLYTGVCFFGTD
jgi:flagellin-specific chaperone FliS